MILVVNVSIVAQSVETPICYAFKGPEATLKYKFSYQDGQYYISFRLVGHGNTLKVGDRIIMESKGMRKMEYLVSEPVIAAAGEQDYIPFKTDYQDILSLQEGLSKILLVEGNSTKNLELTNYCKSCTKKGAKSIVNDAYKVEKLKEHSTLSSERLKERSELAAEKKKVIEAEKEAGLYMVNVSFYHRIYVGYTPTQRSDNLGGGYAEGLTFGYTGGLCLNRKSTTYLEFGVQGDYYQVKNFAVSIPFAITKRFELGNSGATLSPFIGPMVRFNIRESGSDVFQIGGQGGLNLDYKHLNVGIAYHLEAWTKGGSHTRGLVFRLGCTF